MTTHLQQLATIPQASSAMISKPSTKALLVHSSAASKKTDNTTNTCRFVVYEPVRPSPQTGSSRQLWKKALPSEQTPQVQSKVVHLTPVSAPAGRITPDISAVTPKPSAVILPSEVITLSSSDDDDEPSSAKTRLPTPATDPSRDDLLSRMMRELTEYVKSVGGTLEEYQHPVYPDRLIRNYQNAAGMWINEVVFKEKSAAAGCLVGALDDLWDRFEAEEETYQPFDRLYVMPPYYSDPIYPPEVPDTVETLPSIINTPPSKTVYCMRDKAPKMYTEIALVGGARKRQHSEFEPPLLKLSPPSAGMAPMSSISSTFTRVSPAVSSSSTVFSSAKSRPETHTDYALRTAGMSTVYGNINDLLYDYVADDQQERPPKRARIQE